MDLSTWDVVDIEALCASLIDQAGLFYFIFIFSPFFDVVQGYIQGYIYHARPCLVLRKHLGFPAISSVWARNDD